ncbi:pyruvate kinase [candidate division CSSED10-310 bacterium]|uniref:Pyruvate kinase n=1 Tax=candidate division CSSED10-310 bacterium TaxID=2855610 RepID=A0ABV6YW19_UNCC1
MLQHNDAKKLKKRTKIVATLGPACMEEDVMRRMIMAGVNVFRINFSHHKPDTSVAIVTQIRNISRELQLPVAILGDLRGPRIRVGNVRDGKIRLATGHKIIMTPEPVLGDEDRISFSYPHLAGDVAPGTTILIDNGVIILEVKECRENDTIHCLVTRGGELSSRRGMNLPGTKISLPALTQKDIEDVDFAITNQLDFLALSFVQSAEDVVQLKSLLMSKNATIPIIAKIENHHALQDIEAIAGESYGVMVARGDLALEMSIQEIPIAQKRIIDVCRQAAVPVITATQMLESMIDHPQPTRAEATDIANAVLDGTDALMLSGETAIGKYPLETVETMVCIAHRMEEAWLQGETPGPPAMEPREEIDSTIAYASTVIARTLKAATIITHTTTGSTSRRVAKHRPHIPILALTSCQQTQRWLALSWGVDSALIEDIDDTRQLVEAACNEALVFRFAQAGDTLVISAGIPLRMSGKTNFIRVEQIPHH